MKEFIEKFADVLECAPAELTGATKFRELDDWDSIAVALPIPEEAPVMRIVLFVKPNGDILISWIPFFYKDLRWSGMLSYHLH